MVVVGISTWAPIQAPPVPGTGRKSVACTIFGSPFTVKLPSAPAGQRTFKRKLTAFVLGKLTWSDPAQLSGGKIAWPSSQPYPDICKT